MIENLLDATIIFFVIGLVAGILRSEIRLPESIYEILSMYLLLAIGLKGGVQLAETRAGTILLPAVGTVFLGLVIPIIAYAILRKLGKFSRADAAAIAAHYGSVSAVTYAVVQVFLERHAVSFEEYTTVLLVLLEVPAIAVGIFIAKRQAGSNPAPASHLVREVFLGRSIYLLLAGLCAGFVLGPEGITPIKVVFVDPFKGALAFFLLEMGLLASRRLGDLRKVGGFLVLFGMGMPLLSGILGALIGWLVGLSIGGTTILATLAASASYIAAPAAMRIAVPEANPTLYLTSSLGITFPFNLLAGIPIYYWLATVIH
jgi:uncharacterized protein